MPQLLIVDLEATCDENLRIPRAAMEVIEIGAVLVDVDSRGIVDRFQSYIRPAINPDLTAFCTDLTGITQAQVDAAPWFAEALARYAAWLASTFDGSAWASWGNYDKAQFVQDCQRLGLVEPHEELVHLNLKTIFAKALGIRSCGLANAYSHLKQEMTGRHHSALDDAVNIARLLALAPKFGAEVTSLATEA